MAGEGGIVDRLVVAVEYAYDPVVPDKIDADFSGLIGLAGTLAAAMVGLAISTAGMGDEAAKTARTLELTVEEFTALSYAADHANLAQEALRTGIFTLTRQLAMAHTGTGPVADAFRTLGLQSRIMSGEIKTAGQALPIIADALNGITDDGKRAALSMIVLGEAGPKMRSLLSGGSKGLQEATDRARALGVVFSETDATASEHLMDSLADLKYVMKSITTEIGFHFVPSISRVTDSISDWYIANGEIIRQQIGRTLDGISYSLGLLETPVGKAAAGALALASAWGAAGAAKALYEAAKASSPLVAALGSQAGNAIAVAKAAGPLALAIAAAGLAIDDFAVAAEGGDSVLLDLGEAMGARGETQQAAAGLIKLLSAGTDAAWAFAGALEVGLGDALDALAEKLPSLEPLLAPLRELFDLSAADVIGGAAKQFERSAAGLELGTRYLRGDAGVQFRAGRGVGDLIDDFVTFSPNRPESAQSRPAVTVNVNGSNPNEVARIAGEAARREVKQQTLEALSAVGMPP